MSGGGKNLKLLQSFCYAGMALPAYAIGTKEFSYGLCKIWPLSPGFGHYKENSWAFTSLWLHLLGTKTSFLLFALVLPHTTELHPLDARGGAIDAHTLLLCTPVPSPSLPSCILVLTSRLASDQPHVKKNQNTCIWSCLPLPRDVAFLPGCCTDQEGPYPFLFQCVYPSGGSMLAIKQSKENAP